MRRFILSICIALAALTAARADTYFPYPTPPDDLTTLSQRCNYLVEHFWERCNMKQAMSSRQRLSDAFGDYVSFMPHASADTVYASIDALIKQVSKDPKQLLVIGEIAEAKLYSDSAEMKSDDAYLPFAKALAANKKIPAAQRARFAMQAQVLEGSRQGHPIADVEFSYPDGMKQRLYNLGGDPYYTLIYVNDPTCDECRLWRVRLAADYNMRRLVDAGILTVVTLYPDEPDDAWRAKLQEYPQSWIMGSAPDLDQSLDLRGGVPLFYVIDRDKKIIGKGMPVDNVINFCQVLADGFEWRVEPQAEPGSDTNGEAQANE